MFQSNFLYSKLSAHKSFYQNFFQQVSVSKFSDDSIVTVGSVACQ